MVFKLVQIDSENPFKITLEPGTHSFGRGKFLNVNDKRISRQHGQFEVTDDSLVLTALHQNPCFYQKSETTQAQTLREGSSVSLKSGDKLGLLPTSYWYEVLHCSSMISDNSEKTEQKCQQNSPKERAVDLGEDTDNEAETRLNSVTTANLFSENDNAESQTTEILSPCDFNSEQKSDDKASEQEKCDDENVNTIEKPDVDCGQKTEFNSDKSHKDETTSDSLITSNPKIAEPSNNAELSSCDPASTPQKRSHDVSEDEQNEEVKKFKTESEEKPDIKPDSNSQQAGSSSSNNNVAVNVPQAAPAPQRERCMYGATCYRRNPVHRAQFCHPQDADWGAGAKAPCPWGAACRKRDPRHWRDHSHPPGKDQPPPQAGMRVVHRQGNVFYINANTVNFYDDHFEAEDSDGNSVDYDYEF